MDIKNTLEFREGIDTRTNEPLNIYKIKLKLTKEEYIELNKKMKNHQCYYSKFVGGFICKEKLDENMELLDVEKKEPKKVDVVYEKLLTEYMTIEEYKEFVIKYAEENYQNSWNYRVGAYKSVEDCIKIYKEQLLNEIERRVENGYFGELKYIREAIIHKSLGYKIDNFYSNGESLYYVAIWDKLPIIEDLKLTDEAYSAMWGYDQTNVNIAYRLNKRLWGLDVFKDTDGEYYLVRLKNGRFKNKNGVIRFSKDSTPEETFKHDASQTGYYR